MLLRSVIAANITNLTDARYFASWGVDYLMYDLNTVDLPTVKGISEWVDGVKTLIQFDTDNVHLIEEVLMSIKPYAIGASDTFALDKILTYVTDGQVFYNYEKEENPMIVLTDAEHIDVANYHIATNDNILSFLSIETRDALSQHLSEDDSSGIIIHGSNEEEVGLKSFENIDELLELLEDTN